MIFSRHHKNMLIAPGGQECQGSDDCMALELDNSGHVQTVQVLHAHDFVTAVHIEDLPGGGGGHVAGEEEAGGSEFAGI